MWFSSRMICRFIVVHHFLRGQDVVAHPCFILEHPHFVQRQKRNMGCWFQCGHVLQITNSRSISSRERFGNPVRLQRRNARLKLAAWVVSGGTISAKALLFSPRVIHPSQVLAEGIPPYRPRLQIGRAVGFLNWQLMY